MSPRAVVALHRARYGRAVPAVWTYTWRVACELASGMPGPLTLALSVRESTAPLLAFRRRPEYRTPEARLLRARVAAAVRRQRARSVSS